MPRIYIPAFHINDDIISIVDEKAHYLISVLKCREGDDLIIFDGQGNGLKITIVKANKKEVIAEVREKFPCNLESPIHIILGQSLLKGEKMNIVVQKATELGVKEIMSVITERSQLRETRKIGRWRKIAEEAARQSGRGVVPVIHEPIEFKNIFSSHILRFTPHGLLFHEEGGMKLSEAIDRFNYTLSSPLPSMEGKLPLHLVGECKGEEGLLVFIGPEGGFTKGEVALAKEKGIIITSLGRRILRAETAAIAAVTLVQFFFGDLN